jgi:hypothetical protein
VAKTGAGFRFASAGCAESPADHSASAKMTMVALIFMGDPMKEILRHLHTKVQQSVRFGRNPWNLI